MKKIAFGLIALALAQTAIAKGIVAENAYARATVDGMKQSGMFVQLTNTNQKDNALIAAQISPKIAQYTELHTHSHENGVMRMHKIPKIDLPAGETVELKPGSYHIMFFNLKQKLSVGQKFPITLKFQDGTKQKVQVQVKTVAPMNHNHQQHKHQHEENPSENQHHQH